MYKSQAIENIESGVSRLSAARQNIIGTQETSHIFMPENAAWVVI